MKKIFKSSSLIGILIILFVLFHASERASGKTISESISIQERNGTDQVGPPWYDGLWRYRRPILISNSGTFLSYYQILIRLDATNFNFNLAKVDGSDIRLTDSSGRNPLLFWIESWDKQNQLAYLWVLVSSLTPEPNDTTIYLYYDNPSALAVSGNTSPFDFFDDNWCQFTIEGCTQQLQSVDGDGTSSSPMVGQFSNDPLNLPIIAGIYNGYSIDSNAWFPLTTSRPSVTSGILSLNSGVGIRTNNPFQNQAVGFRANYGSGDGHEWAGFINGASGPHTVIGDLTTDLDDLYLQNYLDSSNNLILEGVNDWHNTYHTYEIRWKVDLSTGNRSTGDIDHGATTVSNLTQVPDTPLPLTLYNNNSTPNTTLLVDWVYVRQYRDPEPTNIVGAEQGLVELSINMVDTPDPVRKGATLTYLLTISNLGNINAPGVIVTDTLPASVQIGLINPTQGTCTPGSVIRCDLGVIPSNSTATISIAVTPTTNGLITITNTATLGSQGYELDLSNNTKEQGTLVDSVPPQVEWVLPVVNRQLYYANGGPVLLKALATDDDQIARVEFWLYSGSWERIGTVYASPYQISYNSDLLLPNRQYAIEVYAFDRAGNQNLLVPDEVRQVIFIERELLRRLYMPMAMK